jgi:hybrid cluster-associated redox disulfide protein
MAEKKKAVVKKDSKPAKEDAKKSNSAALVTKDMLIGEVVEKYPKSIEIMFKHGMHCVGCGMTAYESLAEGCLGHGMTEKQIDDMIDEINKSIGK